MYVQMRKLAEQFICFGAPVLVLLIKAVSMQNHRYRA